MGKYAALLADDAPAPKVGKYAALLEEDAPNPIKRVGATGTWDAPPDPLISPEAKGSEVAARSLLPRSFKAVDDGSGLGRQATAGAMDALSAGGRAVAAATENPITPFAYAGAPNSPKSGDVGSFTPEGGRKFANSMADTEGQSAAGRIVRDPALIPSIATGAGVLGLAQNIGLKGIPLLSAAGGLAGAQSGAIHQADNASQGKEIDPISAVGEAAIGAAIPYAPKVAGAIAHGGNKLLGRLAQEFSGVSEEALRTFGAGFGQGAKNLSAAAGKQHEIGQKLVKVLDNLDDYLPEKEIVNRALGDMPPVNVENTIALLETSKSGGALSSSRAVNGKIEDLITDLRAAADNAGNVPANAFRNIRKEIDVLVGDAFGKESGNYVSALKQARHQMADDLVKSAESSGNAEYIDAMKTMAQKLQTADKLKSFLGKSAQTRDTRAESFVSTLFGKNKQDRQNAVKAMEDLFGVEFIADAKLANMAAELGEGGKAGLLPRQFTGRAALGPTVAALGGHFVNPAAAAPALALSSPRIAAGMLSGANVIDRGINKGVSALERIGQRGALTAPIARGLDPELAPNLQALRQPVNLNPQSTTPAGRRVLELPRRRRPLPVEGLKFGDPKVLKARQPDPVDGMVGTPGSSDGIPGFEGMTPPEVLAARQAQAQADRESIVRTARPVRTPAAKETPGGVQVLDQKQLKKQPFKSTIAKDPPKGLGQSRIGFLDANNNRIKMTQYIKATKGYNPEPKEVYAELKKLGNNPVPKIPEKPKIEREFNGRRDSQTLGFVEGAMRGEVPSLPTKAVPVKSAPDKFTIDGIEMRRVKGGYDNVITYKDAQGRKYEFRGDETIHMDFGKDEVPF